MAQFILAQLVKPILSASQARLDLAIRPLVEHDALTRTPGKLAQAIAEKLKDPSVLALPEVNEALLGLDHAWRYQMILLGVILFIALVVAVLAARKTPERYGMQPFGADLSAGGAAAAMERERTTAGAFSQYAIWAVILMFLTSMMGEFLIWAQVVSYWTQDAGFSLQKATSIYAFIGLVGIFSMPILGRIWGLTTMIVMGIGPFTGSYVGGLLQDISGRYTGSICFALGAFLVSAILATTLPLAARTQPPSAG